VLVLVFYGVHGQQANLQVLYGSDIVMVDQLMDFEGITAMKVKFKGNAINGKFYQVSAMEYKDGKFVKSTMLFDGTEVDIFQIDSDSMQFNIFSKFEKNRLKLQVKSDRFSSKVNYLKLYDNKHGYALKDFELGYKVVNVSIIEPIYILGVITPSIHKDGSSSYCEVAYSKVNPETFGKQFNIPHFYLIEVVFKNEVAH
jgi:hypothetical protein